MASASPIDYINIEEDRPSSILVDEIIDEFVAITDYPSHRHNFQELIWIKSGYGTHIIDGVRYSLTPLDLALVGRGQVHKMEEAFGTNGYYIRFTDDFLKEETQILTRLFDPGTINNTISVPESEAQDFEQLLKLLVSEYLKEASFGKFTVLRHFLTALLVKAERYSRLTKAHNTQFEMANYQIYRQFTVLLEEHFRIQHDVGFYAKEVNLTPAQFSKLLHQIVGKTAKRLILERNLLEAKRYLQFTEMSVKEIATTLGYADPYHFSKLFKKAEQLAPQSYRQQWLKK